MRKFYIQNHLGERKNLTNPKGILLKNPAGLGFSITNTFAGIDDGFFALSKATGKQQTIACDLLFMNGYADFKAFVDWLTAAESLTIVYVPGTSEYYCDVKINYLTKTELDRAGVLTVPASFYAVTPWYSPLILKISMRKQSSKAMRYPFRYNSSLLYGSNSAGNYSAEIPAAGHIPSAIDLEYTGQLTNPRLSIVGLSSGKTYGVCDVNAIISDGETFSVSTRQNNSFIRKIDSNGNIVDLTDSIDPSTDPFIRIPTTENCRLSIQSENDLQNEVSVSIYRYYRAV